MTHAEQVYASQQWDPDRERNQLVMQELPQVQFIARRIHERLPQQVPFEDLVQAGVIGLIDAVRNFDSTRGVQLRAFAQFRIRGAIVDSLRTLDWGSRRLRHRGRKIDECLNALEAKLGRRPTDEELAAEAGITIKELHHVLAQLDGLEIVGQQVESPFNRSEFQDVIESAPGKEEDNPFALYAQEESREQLTNAIALLTEKEQMVLSLYYWEELTMREVATVLGVAQSRVSQLHSAALFKLKNALGRTAPE